jgi:hypothetical protein
MVMMASAVTAHASIIYYADWNAATLSSPAANGSASGTITTPTGLLSILYTGDVAPWTQVNNAGTDYYSPFPTVYTNATVSNLPTNVDIITLSQTKAYTNTLVFSAPVINPILDLVSLGAIWGPVSYHFNATPVLLSQSSTYGGCGSCLSVSGNTLTGSEGDGVIEFVGTFSQLIWTTTGIEQWNGFTVGVGGTTAGTNDADTSTTPEPATWTVLLMAAAMGVPLFRRRKPAPSQGRHLRSLSK